MSTEHSKIVMAGSRVVLDNGVECEGEVLCHARPRITERVGCTGYEVGEEVVISRDIIFMSGAVVYAGDIAWVLPMTFDCGDPDVWSTDDPEKRSGLIKVQTHTKERTTVVLKFSNGDTFTALPSTLRTNSTYVKLSTGNTFLAVPNDIKKKDCVLVTDVFSKTTHLIKENVPVHSIKVVNTKRTLQLKKGLVKKASISVRDVLINSCKVHQSSPIVGEYTPSVPVKWWSYAEAYRVFINFGKMLPPRNTAVIISGSATVNHYFAYVASLFNENVLVPIPVTFSAEHVKLVISETEASMAIVDSGLLSFYKHADLKVATLDKRVEGHAFCGEWVEGSKELIIDLPVYTDTDISVQEEALMMFAVHTSPVHTALETHLLVGKCTHPDFGSDVECVARIAGMVRRHTMGWLSVGNKKPHEVVFDILDGLLLIHNEDIRLTASETKAKTFEGIFTHFGTEGNFVLSKPTFSVVKNIHIENLETNCEACGKPRLPYCSGRFVPVTCMDCASRIPRNSQSMGCLSCGLAVCQGCLLDKVDKSNEVNPEAGLPRLVLYTSGSTGIPKGAIVSEGACFKELHGGITRGNREKALLLTSPLAVSSVPSKVLSAIAEGGRIAVTDGANFLPGLREVGPTAVSFAPQMLATFYKDYQGRIAKGEEQNDLNKEFRANFGCRLRLINCGGAKPQKEVMDWTKEVFSYCSVTENYAATETGAISFTSNGELEGVLDEDAEYKLVDWGDYKASNSPPQGELCIKTPYMFSGYLKRDELTSEVLDNDGFFHTGDLVEVREVAGFKPKTFIKVIDRKKAFFKLANSEWVSPSVVEEHLLRSDLIEQIFVHGTSEDQAVVALVVPTKEGITRNMLLEECKRLGTEAGLRRCEIPHAVHLAEPFTEENGLLTITCKLCRPKLQEVFVDTLQDLRQQSNRTYDLDGDDTVATVLRIIRTNLYVVSPCEEDTKAWETLPLHNSIKAMQVSLALNHQLNIKLQPAVLLSGHSLEAILGLCKSDTTAGEVSLEDLQCDLQEALVPPVRETHAGRSGVLVTGASGFLGSAVTQKFLCDGRDVCVLVRSKARFLAAMASRSYTGALPRIIQGDITKPQLSISEADMAHIHGTVGYVVHTAAQVNMLLGYKELKGANVMAVRNVLELCSDGKRFIHVSTVGFTPDSTAPCRLENCMKYTGYNLSKAMAECVVEGAKETGYNVSIVRPGMIGPDTTCGACNVSDYIVRYIMGCAAAHATCVPSGSIYLSCVNYVASVISDELDSTTTVPMHVPAARVDLAALISGLSKQLDLKFCPPAAWLKVLASLPESNPIYPLKHMFAEGIPPMTDHLSSPYYMPPSYDHQAVHNIGEWLLRQPEA